MITGRFRFLSFGFPFFVIPFSFAELYPGFSRIIFSLSFLVSGLFIMHDFRCVGVGFIFYFP